MAWTLDSCEVEINRDLGTFCRVEDLFIREVNDLVFYGRVKDCDDTGLEGALLNVFARRPDGREVPVAQTYSGSNGYYLVNVPKPEFAVSRYIIRSSMSSSPPRPCDQSRGRGASPCPDRDPGVEIATFDE